jgi:hypothetical protein
LRGCRILLLVVVKNNKPPKSYLSKGQATQISMSVTPRVRQKRLWYLLVIWWEQRIRRGEVQCN